jgi:hypothetical protein
MNSGRTIAAATGWLLLLLGGMMALIIGKEDIIVITVGIITSFGGIYVLSLVDPATKQFMGDGWPARLCRLFAGIVGLIMAFSGLIGSIDGIKETLIFQDPAGFSLILVGLLPFCFGIYILNLAIAGVQPQHIA